MEWPRYPLAALVRRIGGGTPSREVTEYWGPGIPWFTVADLSDDLRIQELSCSGESITGKGLEQSAAQRVPKGAVVISTRVVVGKVGVAVNDLATNQDFCSLIPRQGISLNTRFLAYFLLSTRVTLRHQQRGLTISGITAQAVNGLSVPLPSRSEQHRIVEILDQADHLRRLRAEADAKADRILPVLFIKMFGDPRTNVRKLLVVSLGSLIVAGPQNGLYRPSSDYGAGTPILRIDGFYGGQLSSPQYLKRLRLSEEEIDKYSLEKGDIVINRVNSEEYLGKSAIIPDLDEPTIFESNMMRFSVDCARVLPEYVIGHLQTSFTKAEILSKAKRAINQASINQQDVVSLTLLLPPLHEQQRYRELVADHRCLVGRLGQVRDRLEALFMSILQRAFSGKLTASWRTAHMKELLQEMEQQAKALAAEKA